MDPEVLQTLVEANDELILQGRTPNQGVRLSLTDRNGTQLFYGDVHPNVQYEYEAEEAGEYKLCVQLTEKAFVRQNQRIKTKVKFSAEFHRSKSAISFSSSFMANLLFYYQQTEECARKESEVSSTVRQAWLMALRSTVTSMRQPKSKTTRTLQLRVALRCFQSASPRSRLQLIPSQTIKHTCAMRRIVSATSKSAWQAVFSA